MSEVIDMIVDTRVITPQYIDGIYIYIQIFIIAFATPILLEKTIGNAGFTGSPIFKIVVAIVQILLIIGTLIINFNALDVAQREYLQYPSINMIPQCGSYTGFCTTDFFIKTIEYYVTSVTTLGVNNALLSPTYSLQNLLIGNFGRTIIGAELGYLIYQSGMGIITNYSELNKEKKRIEKETFKKLHEIAFDEEYVNKITDDFKKSALASDKNELTSSILSGLQQIHKTQISNATLTLNAASTMAQITMAQSSKREHKTDQSNRGTLKNAITKQNDEIDLR